MCKTCDEVSEAYLKARKQASEAYQKATKNCKG
jgi:hypothetical protein